MPKLSTLLHKLADIQPYKDMNIEELRGVLRLSEIKKADLFTKRSALLLY